MAQLNVVAKSDKTGDHRPSGDKASGPRGAPMQPQVQRAPRAPEARKEAVRRAEQAGLSRVTRFNAPAQDAPAAAPTPQALRLSQASWLRILFIGLILVALVPNVTLALVLWLGLIDPPWQKQEAPPQPQAAAQAPAPAAVLTAPARLEAAAGETIALPLALDGTDGVPPRSVVAVKGLPSGSTLSDGRPYGDSEWNLKPDQIGDLHLALPATAEGEFHVKISLIAPDDKVIADTDTVLKVAPAPQISVVRTEEIPAPDAGQQSGAQAEPNEDDGSVPAGEVPPAQDAQAGAAASDSGRPDAASKRAEDGESSSQWVTPSAYVNLREQPSSSSRVVAVIAKGAKLPVLDRKRGWIEVKNPANGEKGWIYSGYVGGGRHVRPRKRAEPAPAQTTEQSSSFWKWLLQ